MRPGRLRILETSKPVMATVRDVHSHVKSASLVVYDPLLKGGTGHPDVLAETHDRDLTLPRQLVDVTLGDAEELRHLRNGPEPISRRRLGSIGASGSTGE